MSGRTLNAPFGKETWFPVGAGLLIVFALGIVGLARHEGVGLTRMPPAHPVRTLRLTAEDRPDGAILLRDAAHGTLVATVEPGQDNFMRATLRGFGQARLRAGLGREAPFRLTHFDDGSLQLDDELTGRAVNLGAFGPSNFSAFARLMPDLEAVR
ncbi:photosynthetic complex assembly protein PuhC [Methylobacterium sp. J-090]|uniref:photosynthetic complex assembly protein PuhC n=1 Tax=Methylobacterium sp. J-090 TaxID=2836666 RepID=UPI001FBB37D4|nr:photosynthetic complex assembly protein PuhC [Methylobacterium sp. J-090]MCJ2081578.1 putative photosynthetic complex assembly protein PuhC [Methylobacterium sp. J-090]